MNLKHSKEKAFTLIELLVVIAIVGILSSVIYMNITGLRDRAKVTAGIRFDSSTLHSIGDQLVGEWLFDDAQNSATDTSGFGNNGTSASWPTWQATEGYNGKGAYSFNGTNNYIGIGNINKTARTASVWFKPSSIINKDSAAALLLNAEGSFSGIHLGAATTALTNEIISVLDAPGGRSGWCNSTESISAGWHNVTMAWNGSRYDIYLDGVLKNNCISGTPVELSASNVRIGERPNGDYPFNGLIDNVRIYESGLSSSEIQKLYAERKAGYEVATK
ncbi:MAG: LamG-like jellyroll fold domain-containing protein [Candidatus Paceibacterota bacterium]|jgi:prepilin-type N-terminal cleavage/methylation domain-containing protein